MVNEILQLEAVNVLKIKYIKYTLPGLVHIFVYNDSHLSLNQLYVLPNVCLFVCLFV